MSLSSLINYLIGIVVAYFVWRLFIYYLEDDKKERSTKEDFDRLVQKKIQALSNSNLPLESKDSKSQPKLKLIDQYKIKMSSTEKDLYQPMVGLLQSLEWGDSKPFEDLISRYELLTQKKIEIEMVQLVFRFCVNKNVFWRSPDHPLMTYPQAWKLIHSIIVLEKILLSDDLNLLAKDFNLNHQSFKKGALLYISRSNSNLKLDAEKILANDDYFFKLEINIRFACYLNCVLPLGAQMPIYGHELFLEIALNSKPFEILRDLASDHEPGETKVQRACRILGIELSFDEKELKKAYNAQVMMRHPDKVNLPFSTDPWVARINDNFQQVHEAYLLLSEDEKG